MHGKSALAAYSFLAGGGEMGSRIRAFDWASTSLASPADWPDPLKTLVSVMLAAKQPMFIAWGREQTLLYNDPYLPLLGRKHPIALGQPLLDVWAEARTEISPLIDRVFVDGEPVHMDNITLTLDRRGRPEEAHFAFSYTPVRDEQGAMGGLFCACTETTEQVLAERRRISEIERQRRLFERAPGFITILSGPDHVFEFVNQSYVQLFGGRGFVGQTAREAFPELKDQGFFELLDRVYATGERFVASHVPIRLQHSPDAASEERFLDFIYEPMIDDAGAVTGIFCEGHDVTEAHLAQTALRESEEFNRRVLASSNDCIKVLDLDAKLTFMSEGGQRVMEVSDFNAIKGCPWPEFWQGWGRLEAKAAVDAAKAGGSGHFQGPANTMAGTPRYWDVQVTPILGADGQPERILSISRDITETWYAKEELRRVNETLEQQVEERTRERDRAWKNSRDLQVVTDRSGIFHAANEAWTMILGWRPDEVVGRYHLEFVHPDDRLSSDQALITAFADGLPIYENRCLHKDGSYRWIAWVAAAEDDLIYASGRHVTAEKEAAATLAATQEQLRQAQKMEAVGQLTGGLAHDFNNLLTGISGSLELLQTRMAQGRLTDLNRYINAAQGASKRAAALTHRLLAFSRRQTLDPKPTDANSLISGMAELIRRTVGPTIDIEVVGAAGLWPVLVDPPQLENALLNLCINARDAMPEGGHITIETANKWLDDRAARERDLPPGQYLSLCVTDTGTGMSPEVIARAFDPFFTTKRLGEGTGLGLSMIYGFVRQSGGQVRIYSEMGQGTTMCLYLPRHYGEVEEADVLTSLSDAPRAEQGETVLIVDDEPSVRMLVTEVLEDLGYTAIEAADGPAGLKVLQSNVRIDLLVTDVGLPGGMNGRQVADAGRAVRPGLRVLFITGYADNAIVGNGHLEPGMQVLIKPFVMETLASRIKDLIAAP